ncbi:site-specific integrase [Sphingomonas sp. NIBR02145]|uniref:tyrosine-type recombinase/integrase n=1 Tax=Sphingomonas sp. NIBR02145 TaxID=3014784 RepID=UPI0022B2E135|nr:site-specific integrase [Sphingomonas sp. NIBR02145]WHU03658.1 site-specific integrase [Sphingomonas sp. NIBR02145]
MARIVRNQRLDSRSARALLARRHAPYWHPLTRGRALGYRKGAKGGIWLAKYRTADGKREQLLLGAADDAFDGETSDVLTFAAAQAKARDWFEALDRDAGRRRPRYTVEDALDDYIANFSGKSLDKTRYVIDRLVRPEFKNVQVSDLTTERLREFLEKIASRRSVYRANKKGVRKERPVRDDAVRVQQANANRAFTPLRAALNRAFALGKVADDSAWRRVKPYAKVSAPRIRYFTGPEIHRLIEHAPDWFRPLIQAALLTGARWSEIHRVRVRDVDLMSGVLTFPDTKSGRPRFVHLSDEGIQLFRGLCMGRRTDELVFLNQHDRELGTSHQIRPMRETCEAAGVEPAGFHILRHTYGSRLAMAGVPMAVIAEALGHADERITRKHYAHLCPSYVRDAVRAGLGDYGIVRKQAGLRLVR